MASLLSPTLPTRMTWEAGCEKIIVRFERSDVEKQLSSMIEAPVKAIEFWTALSLVSECGKLIANHVQLLLEASGHGSG
ncbi:hypothetical protein MXD81_14860, partial [Microbacteriaceae bacterium K1510]|nr:hypothetical protein [Microbacteriaceae bacterium K1510]